MRGLAGLDHPGVVGMWDVLSTDGYLWLVMEHVPSRPLAEVIAAAGPLAPTEVELAGVVAREPGAQRELGDEDRPQDPTGHGERGAERSVVDDRLREDEQEEEQLLWAAGSLVVAFSVVVHGVTAMPGRRW